MDKRQQRRVEVIPAKSIISSRRPLRKKRVCAYCRVSTQQDQQLDSLENQIQHYEQLAKEHPAWEFVGIYADEGLSGTRLKKRDEFNRMIDDARAGKIDMILIKSLSRYCRNTIDSLKTARENEGIKLWII